MPTSVTVSSGVTSSGLTISAGETLYVLSGGTVSGIIVSGGYENVASGGHDYGATVENGGTLDMYGSGVNETILSGGLAGDNVAGYFVSATVGSGGTLNIYSEADNTTVSGGTFNVVSAGFANYTIVESGGLLDNSAINGSVFSTTIRNGGTAIGSGQTEFFDTVISSGGILYSASNALVFQTTNNGGQVLPLCFAMGTQLQTGRGMIAVEELVVGETVVAHFAGTAPIVWIGKRTIDCRRHARPEGVWPVRVKAGAFGEGVPRRDVMLSPDHAVFVADVLVPVRELVDGGMIVQERVDSVTYYHVELAQHDVLFAEGLPAESYLDTGNRANFQGEAGVIALHPEFAALAWDALGCAPLVLAGPELAAARRMVVKVDEPGWAQGIVATA